MPEIGCPTSERSAHRSGLGDLDREYTLSEIAIITRAGPARMLGLANKGHLGAGADADVTIYTPDDDKEPMFALPRYVIKGGEVVVDDGELRRVRRTGCCSRGRAGVRSRGEPRSGAAVRERYTVAFEHYPVRDPALREPARIVEAAAVSGYLLRRYAEVVDTFAEAFPMTRARDRDHGRAPTPGRGRRAGR